jgi:hypothetical protein
MGVAVEAGGELWGGAVGRLDNRQPLPSERARIKRSEIIRYFMFIPFIIFIASSYR